jgi:branched-chain amino acid transport system substrate-binding protein
MKIKHVGLAIVAVLIVAAALLALQPAPAAETKVRIGLSAHLTGPVALVGSIGRDAIVLANELRTEAGGRKIELVVEDDKSLAAEAVTVFRKFVEVDGLKVVIASGSTTSLATAPLAEQAKVIQMTWLGATPALTGAGDYVFRTSSSSDRMAQIVAPLLKKNGFERMAILYENVDYPVGWKDVFVKRFTGLGGVITAVEASERGALDVKTQLVKLKDSAPDAIFLMTQNPAVAKAMLKQYKELGIGIQPLGIEVFSLRAVREDANLTEGMLVVSYNWDPKMPEMKGFLQAFEKKYGKPVGEEIYGALAFDAYNLLADAIGSCGEETACIRDELYEVKDYRGASGTFSIDENGDALHEFVISRVKDGQLVESSE